MNKTLLAMAVSAAIFAPVAAQADVTVYGRVQVEYNIEDSDGATNGSQQSVDDNAGQSRLGFKFSEKLGGGMTAFGKLEYRVDAADVAGSGTNVNTAGTAGGLGQRDAFVGLKSSWGSIAAGSFHSPYKTAGGVKWDPFVATHLQARRAGGMTGGAGIGGHNGFMRNAIYYTSPDVSGFKVQFAISPDETNVGASENVYDGDNDWSLAAQYKNGPWHAIFAYNKNYNPGTQSDEKLWKIGLRWKSGPFTVAGQYEDVSDADRVATGTTPGSGTTAEAYSICSGCDGNVYWLNGQYKAGNNIFALSWGMTEASVPAAPDYSYDYWAAGVIHKFSKKTRIFGGYTQTSGDSDGNPDDRDAWTLGIRQDF